MNDLTSCEEIPICPVCKEKATIDFFDEEGDDMFKAWSCYDCKLILKVIEN
jgi:hypothetical protein